MTIANIDKYLESRINAWYHNSMIDYGINGKFIRAEANGNDLLIIWEEDHERQEYVIPWFTEYTLEQLYNIWMEMP